MKVTLSKAQWEAAGVKAGWMKVAAIDLSKYNKPKKTKYFVWSRKNQKWVRKGGGWTNSSSEALDYKSDDVAKRVVDTSNAQNGNDDFEVSKF